MSDLISRQDAINVVKGIDSSFVKYIEELPSAQPEQGCDECIFKPFKQFQPEQKHGRWIKFSPAGIYECSVCHQDVMTADIDVYKFCHGCGARMDEVEQEGENR